MRIRKRLNIAVLVFALVFFTGSALAYNYGDFGRFTGFSTGERPFLEILRVYELTGHTGATIYVREPMLNNYGNSVVSFDLNFGSATIGNSIYVGFEVQNNSPQPLPVIYQSNNRPEWLGISPVQVQNPIPAGESTRAVLRFEIYNLDFLDFDDDNPNVGTQSGVFDITVLADVAGLLNGGGPPTNGGTGGGTGGGGGNDTGAGGGAGSGGAGGGTGGGGAGGGTGGADAGSGADVPNDPAFVPPETPTFSPEVPNLVQDDLFAQAVIEDSFVTAPAFDIPLGEMVFAASGETLEDDPNLVAVGDGFIPLTVLDFDHDDDLLAIALPEIPLEALNFLASDTPLGFQWWMLLPLLLIPFILFHKRKVAVMFYTGIETEPYYVYILRGKKASVPETIKHEGEGAIGWYRSKKLEDKYLWDFNKRVLFRKKLYAKWPAFTSVKPE